MQTSLTQLNESCSSAQAEIRDLKDATYKLDAQIARARQQLTQRQVSDSLAGQTDDESHRQSCEAEKVQLQKRILELKRRVQKLALHLQEETISNMAESPG